MPHHPHFTVDEYRRRLTSVQERMEGRRLDALLLHQQENVAWLGGFWHDGFFAYHALVVPRSGDPILVERRLEDPVARELSWVSDRRGYLDGEDPIALAAAAVRDVTAPGAAVGLEWDSPYLPLRRHQRIAELLPEARLVPHEDVVEEAMRIKSPQELAHVRRASSIASEAVAAGLDAVEVGATELDVAAAIARTQARHGHDSFLGAPGGTICTGWRTHQLHGQQSDRVIEVGDRVRLELPGIHRQYWAKQMRSATVRTPDPELERAHDIVSSAQEKGIAAMGPGVPAAEIAEICRRPVLDAGLAEHYENRVGYGMGLQFHPTSGDFGLDIDHRSSDTLQPGMVFHMLLFAAGAAISETVAVTEQGHEILTHGPRDLRTVG